MIFSRPLGVFGVLSVRGRFLAWPSSGVARLRPVLMPRAPPCWAAFCALWRSCPMGLMGVMADTTLEEMEPGVAGVEPLPERGLPLGVRPRARNRSSRVFCLESEWRFLVTFL